MEKMTITEALAEIKLIEKKIDKKKDMVYGNLCRFSPQPDPFEKTGGAITTLNGEVQSCGDLWQRWIKIRSAIATVNLVHEITIEGHTKSIYEWLIWKREIAEKQIQFYKKIYMDTKMHIDANAKNPKLLQDPSIKDSKPQLVDLITYFNYPEYIKKEEHFSMVLDKLDGQLSLKNALITIEI